MKCRAKCSACGKYFEYEIINKPRKRCGTCVASHKSGYYASHTEKMQLYNRNRYRQKHNLGEDGTPAGKN